MRTYNNMFGSPGRLLAPPSARSARADGALALRVPALPMQWYFETFCAVPPEQFRARRLESLEADAPIIQHLCGYVKPYDIVALMEVLPVTRNLAPSVALRVPVAHADSSRRPSAGGGAVVHRLRLGAAQAVDARFVERLLRATYHEVVLATAAVAAAGEKRRRAASRRSSSAAAVFPTRARGGGEDGMAAARPASSSHATATTQGPPSAQLSPLRALTRAQPSSLPLAPATGRGIGRALSSSFSASPLAAARSEQTSPAINSSLRGRLACATQLPCDERQSRASSAHVTAEERHSGASRTDALSTRVAAASSSRHSAAASTGGGGGGGGARSSRSPAHSRASATRGAAPWTHGEGSAGALASGSSAAAVDGDGLSGRAQAARSSGAGGQQAGSGVGLAEAVGSPLCVQRSPNLSSAVRWLASRISRASSFADSPRVGDWGASSLMGAAQLRAERLSAAHTALANALAAAHARNARTTMAALFIGCVSFGSAVVLLFVQALSLRGSAAAAGGGSALTSAELIDLYALGTVPLWNGVLHVLYCTGLQTVAIALHPIDSARGRRVTRAAGHFVLLVISCNVALNAYALHLFLPGAAARQLGTPGPPLLTFLVVHVNVVVAIAWLYLLGALCGRWRTGGALATTIGHACTVALWGNFFPFAICYWALAISPRSIPVSVAPWDRNMTIAAALSTLALVLTLACADTTARLRVHALLGRAMSAEGEQAALGALVGFGSAHQRPARDLIEEASKLFVPIELTPDALERIAQALDRSPARKRRPPTGASPPRRSSCDWPCPWRGGGAGGRGRRRPLDGAWQQGDELATRRMASEGDGSIARGYGHRWRDWTGVGGSSAGRATHSSSGRASMAEPGIADAYVVHSSADPPALRARLLAEWAAAFAQREGRPAVVWLDCACADPGLEAHELLAHMPCYLALCTQLLVLGGPTLTEQLLCVAQLFAWRAMGMPLERVVVLPFGNGANAQPPHEQAIAALDAFHVMYAVSAPKGVRKRIVRMIGLATVATVNEVVQAYAVAVVKPPPSL